LQKLVLEWDSICSDSHLRLHLLPHDSVANSLEFSAKSTGHHIVDDWVECGADVLQQAGPMVKPEASLAFGATATLFVLHDQPLQMIGQIANEEQGSDHD